MSKTLGIFLTLAIMSATAFAGEKDRDNRDWFISQRLGFSPHTGVIGLETEYKKVALTLGFPYAIGLKFYSRPTLNSWFAGPFYMHFSGNHTETYQGVEYDHYRWTVVGIGGGYRWYWYPHWTANVGIGYAKFTHDYLNSAGSAEQKSYGVLPDITVGYTF